jgi:hypothetical protein
MAIARSVKLVVMNALFKCSSKRSKSPSHLIRNRLPVFLCDHDEKTFSAKALPSGKLEMEAYHVLPRYSIASVNWCQAAFERWTDLKMGAYLWP